MATRLTGEIRLRLSRDSARAHIPHARKLLGELKEQLAYNNLKVGQLTRTLDDGTTIRALYDGTLFIAEVVAAEDKGKCSASIPDIIGLATAITDPEENPPAEAPPLTAPDLPVTRYTSIVGWVVPRPVPQAMFEGLLGINARARWAADGVRPPGTESIPKGLYSRVVDACGNTHKLHENLVYGNFDWTNGRDVLTCWSGMANGQQFLPGQRYGQPGVAAMVYLRGRLLHTIPTGRVVNGIALRTVAGAKYLMVVWRNILNNNGGLQRIPISWAADRPYPKVGVAEDVATFQQSTTAMWCFNASGTEARRIAPNMTDDTCEQILTDDGIEYLDSADLVVEDTFTVTGTSSARYVWLAFTKEFYSITNDHPLPLRKPAGTVYDELYDAYFEYGENINATGVGVRTVKVAVDYIGDVPEYLLSSISGGSTVLTDSPNTTYTLTTDIDTVVATNPGPHPCPSSVPNTATVTTELQHQLDATQSKTTATTSVTHSYFSTTYTTPVTETWETLDETVSASATVLNHYTYLSITDEMIETDVSCYTSGSYITGYYQEQNDIYRLDRSQSVSSTAVSQLDTLLYVDLRQGVFVVHRTRGTVVLSDSNVMTVGIEHGVTTDAPSDPWRYYTDDSSSTTTTTISGGEDLFVYYQGAEVYTNTITVTPTSTTTSSGSTPANLDPDDSLIVNQGRAHPFIWEYFAGVHLDTIEGSPVPPDAYDYGGSPGNPDPENWYANSAYAVTSSGAYSGTDAKYVEQVTGSWGYPLLNSKPAAFRQTVVYRPDNPGAAPEDYTYNSDLSQVAVTFGVVANNTDLFLSMPLPTAGYGVDWTVVNVLPEWVYTSTGAPETYRFYPMSFISPAF